MIKFTRYLVIISVVLSFVSSVTIKKFGQEIYPFFSWKLFAKPPQPTLQQEDYRIYGIRNGDTIRFSYKRNLPLTVNEQDLLVGQFASKIIENKKIDSKRLKKFSQLIAPEFKEFVLVKETFFFVEEYNPNVYEKEFLLFYQ